MRHVFLALRPRPKERPAARGRPSGPAIPDEGLGGIVAPVRAKAPRSSSPTPATRLPGRPGKPERQNGFSASPAQGSPGSEGTTTCRLQLKRGLFSYFFAYFLQIYSFFTSFLMEIN